MKRQLQSWAEGAKRLDQKVRRMLLVPVVALLCSPALAALPTMPAPGPGIGGQAAGGQGDMLGTMGAWFKTGITIFVLVVVALGFLYVMMGALTKWRSYSMGRSDVGELKEYIIMGAILGVFLIVIATYAIETMA